MEAMPGVELTPKVNVLNKQERWQRRHARPVHVHDDVLSLITTAKTCALVVLKI